MLLEDKVALITGGTSGIGLATAHLFASEGASVAIVGRSQERGAKALKYLSSRGYEATYHRGDVSKEEDSIRVVKEVVEIYGCLLYTSPSPRDLSTSRMPSSA